MVADEAAEAAPALDAIGALLLVSGAPPLANLPLPPSAAEAAALPPTSSVAGARGAAQRQARPELGISSAKAFGRGVTE